MEKSFIEGYLLQYLQKREVKIKVAGKVTMLECPYCHKSPMSATIPPRCNFITCFSCNSHKKTVIDLVRDIEKIEGTDDDITHYIKELLNLDVVTKKDKEQTDEVLKFYKENGFDLVPVARDKKIPIETDWTNKEHKDVGEWQRWLGDGVNIGIKTGKRSNITIIDVDVKPVPQEIATLVGDTFTLETSKGFQFYYKYVPDLPKTRINDLKIDIENDGGQCVAYPSVVDGVKRKIIGGKDYIRTVIEMPKALLDFLKTRVTVPLKSFSEKLKEDIATEDFNLELLEEGERNSSLMKLGGLLRKELNVNQTERVLGILNRHICASPITPKELSAMVKSLSKYTTFDENELAHRVLSYLKDVEEAGRTEICMAIMATNKGEDKMRVDKVLNYLVKEQYILKKGRGYCIIKKLDWKDDLLEVGKPIDFKMPYFDDIACFNYGDLVLIGSKNKRGKTSIAINMIKELVEQGKTPFYINLETGSRYAKTALKLGLKNGDFKYAFCADPTQIELEKNAITIIDWLLISDKSQTDGVFKHFIEQLDKQGGFLVVFMQLKEDNGWFAPNMVTQFPALGAKYIYDNENDGVYGKFVIDPIREPKGYIKNFEIPCKYNWESKEFKRVEDLEKKPVKEQETSKTSEVSKEPPKEGEIQIDTQEISN
jgi:hypothetical protein